MVKKKDPSLWLRRKMVLTGCVPTRKLNKVTEVDPEPVTPAEDLSVDSVA